MRPAREPPTQRKIEHAGQHLRDIHPIQRDAVPRVEVVDKPDELGRPFGVAAEVVAGLDPPFPDPATERRRLQRLHLPNKELATLQAGEPHRSLAGFEPGGDPSEGAARPHRSTDHVAIGADLLGNGPAGPHSQLVTTTLGNHIAVPKTFQQTRDHLRISLATISSPIHVRKPHPVSDDAGQDRIQGQVLLPADHSDRLEPEQPPGRSHRRDVIRERATESQQTPVALCASHFQVRDQLPPLVPRYCRMDQILTSQ